jgi:lysophospholipase L1-like esterase
MTAKVRRHILIAVSALFLAVGPVGAQDRSASEAESVEQVAGTAVTDPLRSDALAFLGSETQSLIGQEHLAHFLGRFRDLLIGVPLAEGHEALSILHFGGSHVQAGRIGWTFRKRLSEDRPDLIVSRGILPPHRLAGENGPPQVRWASRALWTGQRSAHRRHEGEWGLTGLETSALGADTVRLWNGESHGPGCIAGVEVLNPPGHQWAWADSGADTLLLWTPDSLARLHGVWVKEKDAALVFHDLGGNGASTAAWLRHPHLGQQLARCPADLAILAWGINDAHMAPDRFREHRFAERYADIILRLREARPDIEILLVTNNDSHYRRRHNPNSERVRQAMVSLSDELGVACWDLYGALGGAHSIERLREEGFAATDHLHFNRTGYELIGELLYATLMRAALDHALAP